MSLDLGSSGEGVRHDGYGERITGVITLCSLVLVSAGFYVYATQNGLALGSDSAAYIAAGRNFIQGFGLSWLSGGVDVKPLVLHAPLYPLILAASEALSIDAIATARVINGLAFAMTIVFFCTLLFRTTGSWYFSALGAFILLATGEFFQVYVWAMSDPLFIALSLSAMVAMHLFLMGNSKLALSAAAVAASAAFLTRYAGLALVVALTVVLMAAPGKPRLRRLFWAGTFFVVGVFPTSIWFLRNQRLTGQIAGRMFGRNAASIIEGSEQTVSIILNWFLPLNFVEWLRAHSPLLALAGLVGIICLLIICTLCYRAWVKRTAARQSSALLLIGIFMLAYLGLMAYSYLFSRPGTDLIERTLSPIYPATLALVTVALDWLWEFRKLWLRALIVLGCLFLIRNKSVYTNHVVDDLIHRGFGYSSRRWRQSETIKTLEDLSPDLVYTDDIAAVYLLANPDVILVPQRIGGMDGKLRPDYESELSTMHERIESGEALLVLFEQDTLQQEWAPLDSLIDGLAPIAILEDGFIYGSDK